MVGENGAGKSTLGKIIGGYHLRDSGDLVVFGERVDPWDTKLALDRGIAMIHQELALAGGLTVAQNVFLGLETHRLGVLRGDENERLAGLDARCGFGLDPTALVGALRIADRQKVEIMRALARDARVIIMDEPTSALSADETAKLHEIMVRLVRDARSIIYVTHFLEHALELSGRVTVMRDGHVVRTAAARSETKASLVEAMLGRAAEVAFPARAPVPAPDAPPALEVRRLATDTGVRDVSFTVRRGEIVGLLGLVGSGRSETARVIFGADPKQSGEMRLFGKPYAPRSPREAVARGVVMIPEDRRGQGLVTQGSVRHNVTLPHLAGLQRAGVVRRTGERRRVADSIRQLGIVPARLDGIVAEYSGGNQQKVLFAKWMFGEPKVVVLDEPTRGVDVGREAPHLRADRRFREERGGRVADLVGARRGDRPRASGVPAQGGALGRRGRDDPHPRRRHPVPAVRP